MRTVRRLLWRDITGSVAFVALAFLALFFFIDLVDELSSVGRQGYTVWNALHAGALEVPGNLYEVFPIAVLIGTIYTMARLAQSSEFTILRTGGLGPGRALGLLATLGAAFAVFTWVLGDHVVPHARQAMVEMKAEARGGRALGPIGAWLRDRRSTPDGDRVVSINVRSISPQGELAGVRIFEFDTRGLLIERIAARTARVDAAAVWTLSGVERTRWPQGDGQPVATEQLAELRWASNVPAGVVAAAVLPLGSMSTIELWRYTSHLTDQEQAVQQHAIQFWKKALYPFACLVMTALALPFAYLHARAGGVSFKVFGGIMLGIAFILLNNLSGHLGLLGDWTPWLAAAAPSALFLLLSLGAFAWLVRYR